MADSLPDLLFLEEELEEEELEEEELDEEELEEEELLVAQLASEKNMLTVIVSNKKLAFTNIFKFFFC